MIMMILRKIKTIVKYRLISINLNDMPRHFKTEFQRLSYYAIFLRAGHAEAAKVINTFLELTHRWVG
jgi:hypothetical protein